jgi:hypothetical protein
MDIHEFIVKKLFLKNIALGESLSKPLFSSYFFAKLMSDWLDFEKFVSEVLELHHFDSFWNVNITITGIRRQFDIIARKNDEIIGIDCKLWDNKKTKKSSLVNSAKKQKDRCLLLAQLFGLAITPLIITNKEDLCGEFENINIVPLNRLNSYLLDNY